MPKLVLDDIDLIDLIQVHFHQKMLLDLVNAEGLEDISVVF